MMRIEACKCPAYFARVPSAFLLFSLVCIIAGRTGHAYGCGLQQRRSQLQPPRPSVSQKIEPASATVVVSPDDDYKIGASDVIEIQIEDAPELSGTFRVSSSGSIALPFLGRVLVHQKTAEEVGKFVADGLRGQYLNDPLVKVVVREINSHSFFIQGAVRRPGLYQIEGRPSLLKLITVAGGMADNYGSTAYVIRQIKPQKPAYNNAEPPTPNAQSLQSESADDAKYELIKVNINSLLRGGFEQNMLVEPGDMINIPPSDVFFVAGEVNAPGSFPLKEGTTLRQAISLAQGTTFKAALTRGIIFREDLATARRQEIKADINAVMNGKLEDMPIMANDIIIVPNSRIKSVTSALLTAFGVNSARIPARVYY